MELSYNGLDRACATFLTRTAVNVGQPVIVQNSFMVGPSGSDAYFCGVVRAYDGTYATIQIKGAVTLGYTGNAPVPGYTKLAADGKGGVKGGVTNAREFLVLGVDETAKTVTFML